MPNFTIEEITAAMKNVDNIRNFSIVAQVDAGKSTLSDSLLCHAGIISAKDAGDKRATDTMKQEQERGITIKAVGVSMCIPHAGKDYVINLIDSPGHVDFSAEVTAAIRVTDGALVLIDTIDGVKAQTKTVLTQSLEERVKPALVINKIDKMFLSLKLKPDEIYNQFVKNVDDVNGVIGDYQDPKMVELTRDQRVDPVRGDVAMAAAYHTWGYSLKSFARIYAAKSGNTSDENLKKMMKQLWLPKNFCDMIVKPIYVVLNACSSHPEVGPDGKDLKQIAASLKIELTSDTFELKGKDLMKRVMGSWLPVAECVVELAVDHLPSPKTAQRYRTELLYKGPKDDKFFKAIQECDPEGPMIIYISKMVPTKDNSHFYAFGRVFAGTARSGKIKTLMNDHDPLNKEVDEKHKTFLNDVIQRVVLMMASKIESVEAIPVGNTLGLDGVDKTMIKSGTIVDSESGNCYPLKNMNFSVSPVVRYSIKPKNAGDLSKFTETLKKFVKSDPCLQYIFTSDGEHVLAGAGELHLEVAIEQLRTDFLKNIEFVISEPIVPYMETITEKSSQQCLAKSPNKHNRYFCTAQPLTTQLVDEMLKGDLPKDPKDRAKYLETNHDFGEDGRKLWAIGPELEPCNMIIDMTKGVAYMAEIKDNTVGGFLATIDKGPLAEEPIRGYRLDIEDVTLHADAIHRGAGQLMPAVRSIIYSTMLTAQPRLLEPVFKVEIALPRERVSSIYNVMTKRRGNVGLITESPNGNSATVEAELPVAESFGFIEELRGATSGTAFANMAFSHWQVVPGDPMELNSFAYNIVMKIRKRKGLKLELPKLEDFLDKL